MNKLCSLVIGASVIGLSVYLIQKLPQPNTNSRTFVEQCWNLSVSVIDRPVSSSTIWVLGAISKLGDPYGALVASYASQNELSPAARHGLCVSLEKLTQSSLAVQVACESKEKLSHLTTAAGQEFCSALKKASAPAPAEQPNPIAIDKKG